MKKTLILLTKAYPFGSGEQYINNELPYLAEVFDRVIVYPNDYYGKGEVSTKELPPKVEVLNFNAIYQKYNNKHYRDIWMLIKITVMEFMLTDDKKNFFKNFRWNIINFWTQLTLANAFSKRLKEEPYGELVFYSYWFHKSAIFLSILKEKGIITSFVARAHSVDLYHQRWGIIDKNIKVPPYKFFKLKAVDKVFCVSEHGERFLKTSFRKYADKIVTSYLGVSERNLEKTESPVLRIVTCSGIDYNKRIHLLAEALREVTDRVEWVHFGDGPMKEDVLKALKQCGSNINASLKGQVSNNEIRNYLATQQVDLFVNLSIVEGLPVSIIEAMASKIAIMATAVYGTPEAVKENENGFLLDVNVTPTELAKKITYCVSHREQLKMMGQKSYELFATKFEASKNYKQFANDLIS